jgi:hypothetical protein
MTANFLRRQHGQNRADMAVLAIRCANRFQLQNKI